MYWLQRSMLTIKLGMQVCQDHCPGTVAVHQEIFAQHNVPSLHRTLQYASVMPANITSLVAPLAEIPAHTWSLIRRLDLCFSFLVLFIVETESTVVFSAFVTEHNISQLFLGLNLFFTPNYSFSLRGDSLVGCELGHIIVNCYDRYVLSTKQYYR